MSYTCNGDAAAIKPARPMKPWNKRLIGEFEYEVWHFHINDCWTVCQCAMKRCVLAIPYYSSVTATHKINTVRVLNGSWLILCYYSCVERNAISCYCVSIAATILQYVNDTFDQHMNICRGCISLFTKFINFLTIPSQYIIT